MTHLPPARTKVRSRALAACLLAGTAACQDYLFEEKVEQRITESQIVQPAVKPQPADILFIIDNSGSMEDEQRKLAASFELFINQIAGAGDYQIAIATTDLSSVTSNDYPGGAGKPIEVGGFSKTTFQATFPNRATDFGNGSNVCKFLTNGIEHGCFRGDDPATRIISSKTMSREQQIAAFQANVLVGSCGSGREQGIAGALRALQNAAPGKCNAGFLRQGANLVVIIVSDEEDTDDMAIDTYLTELLRIKPAAQVRLAMVTGSVDGTATNCRTNNNATCGSFCMNRPAAGSGQACSNTPPVVACPANEFCDMNRCKNIDLQWFDVPGPGCLFCSYYNTPDCCSALAGNRYIQFATALERKVNAADAAVKIQNCKGSMQNTPVACLLASICQENFGETLKRIARDLVIRTEYTLDPPAIYPPGVVVRVKNGRFGATGKTLAQGTDYTISDDGRTIRLKGENTPVEGEEIEIYYVVEKS